MARPAPGCVAIETTGQDRAAPASSETRALALEILGGLSEDDAALAVYLYCDELTHDEVADLLGCSRRHVGDLANRLRRRIMERVSHDRQISTPRSLSELAIDRMLAGELAAVDANALRDHAASCPRCSAALDDALSKRQARRRAAGRCSLPRRRYRAARTRRAMAPRPRPSR